MGFMVCPRSSFHLCKLEMLIKKYQLLQKQQQKNSQKMLLSLPEMLPKAWKIIKAEIYASKPGLIHLSQL